MANKEKVLKECNNNILDIIHFSCHGKFIGDPPLSSYVKLNDGLLTAKEVFSMRLKTELVTLSACETGLSDISRGDELVGFTRAFLYAGAPSVVVGLWTVDALAAEELMLEFYKRLKSGADKASALQEAQKKIMEKYPNPYYWARFILVGDSI